MFIQLRWTDPGNDGSHPPLARLEIKRITQTMIVLKYGCHDRELRFRRKDGKTVGDKKDWYGWIISEEDRGLLSWIHHTKNKVIKHKVIKPEEW